jgi:hypothetical protein
MITQKDIDFAQARIDKDRIRGQTGLTLFPAADLETWSGLEIGVTSDNYVLRCADITEIKDFDKRGPL